ncbi:MAG: AarF/ABC1/UbiB kinase family protein [Planctomycetes bacterium]|nr:AarF/ABC1/UbiB kinase family protein [Planctomycetota bacterium]
MRITSLPRYYRNIKRWREIIQVLRRYGLADWLSTLRVDFVRDWIKDDQGVPLASYSREARVRMALTELGPTFIKLGQVLSLRPDLVGSDLAAELQLLQAKVPADSFDSVKRVVESELKKPIAEAFDWFDENAMASASIGQAHEARLPDGTRVVVKVQHENIRGKINEDLEVLAGLATLAERIPELAAWQPRSIVDQLSRSLKRELSFSQEQANLMMMRESFKDFPGILIPKAYASHSSARVLAMDQLQGRSINDVHNHELFPDLDLDALAHRVAAIYVDMIFVHGLYHADPHPGNILIQQDGTIGLLDFGMVGRIDDGLRGNIEEMLWALALKDSGLLTSLIKRVGRTPPTIDESLLSNDVTDMIATYGSQPLENIDLASALNDLTDILHRHRIILPSQLGLLIKTLVTLQGTISKTSPKFSLLEAIEPMFKKLWRSRYSPSRQIRRMRRLYFEMEGLVEKLPSQISSLMELVQSGKLDVHLTHRGLSPSINRLVLGLLTSSLLLGSSILMASKVPPLLFVNGGPLGLQDLSLIGLLGFLFSLMVAFRILLAINKSGHLDTEYDEHDWNP